MKINKHWHLSSSLYPDTNDWGLASASQYQFNQCTIIYYDNDSNFRPIVLSPNSVRSMESWKPSSFYRSLLKSLNILDPSSSRSFQRFNSQYRYRMQTTYNSFAGKLEIEWGCRVFTKRRLLLIKAEMEEYYGLERLMTK